MTDSRNQRGMRHPSGGFVHAYAGSSASLRAARNDVVGWLREHGLDEDLQDRAALVVSELCTNAVQASPRSNFEVRVDLDGARNAAAVSVTSRTGYEQPPPREHWRPTSVFAPRGRGLLIVDELADDVQVELPGSRTVVVTATFRSPGRRQQA